MVGHFDLIRMHDKDYRQRLEIPKIKERIQRNLKKIKDLGSILDFNLRSVFKTVFGFDVGVLTEHLQVSTKNPERKVSDEYAVSISD